MQILHISSASSKQIYGIDAFHICTDKEDLHLSSERENNSMKVSSFLLHIINFLKHMNAENMRTSSSKCHLQ